MDINDRAPGASPDSTPAIHSADVLLWGALPHLQLNIAQTADLCGISVRQLGYWTKQGYVAASGRGARRLYGLDSLRYVLAIKNAMAGGVSLRQAIKELPGAVAPGGALPPLTSPPESREMIATVLSETHPTRSSEEREVLMADLVGLFAANPRTRDDASGLAVKIGRSAADIRDIADELCSQGVLSKTASQGSIVFENARMERV